MSLTSRLTLHFHGSSRRCQYYLTQFSRLKSSQAAAKEKIASNNLHVYESQHSKDTSTPCLSKVEDKLSSQLSCFERIDLSFSDTKSIFVSKSTSELIRALLVFRLCSFNVLVDYNKQLLKWSRRLFGRSIFRLLMRSTFYGHFVAGESRDEIRPVISQMRQFGVKSILDYSVEKDVLGSEALAQEIQFQEESVERLPVRPDAATTMYQSSLHFADRSENVTSARTYVYEGEEQCDRNMETFIRCIDAVSDSTRKEGFAAIKLTALGMPQLLLEMSDVLMQMERFFNLLVTENSADLPPSMRRIDRQSFRQNLERLGVEISYDEELEWFTLLDVSGEGEIDMLEWSQLKNFENNLPKIFRVRNTQTGEYEQLVPSLTEDGLNEMRNMLRRVDTIATHAKSQEVRLMIDAEQSYLQPAIRRIGMEMMRKYNKEIAIVFNTYQCYLKNSADQISVDLKLSQQEDFYFGAKLVRGAYMEQERARAAKLGYDDPVNPSFEATTHQYEKVLKDVFTHINQRPKGRIAVMVASHNEDTVRNAVKQMNHYGILPEDRLICFGQLLGMCDQISFTLGQSGYSVYKYVPYGPIEEVLPYLSRRAMENKGFIGKAKRERNLLLGEIMRRLRSGELTKYPAVTNV